MPDHQLKRCVYFLLASSLVLIFPLLVTAQDPAATEIEYAYPDQSVWTTQIDASGQLANPLLEYAEALFTKAGMAWSSNAYPAGRMFERLQNGKSSFSMLVKASILEKDCLFSEKPITYTELRVYRLNSSAPVKKIDDLIGRELIAMRGYSYGKIGKFFRNPENKITYYETDRHKSAFDMLRHSRADYLLDYAGPSEEILASDPIPDIAYDVLDRLNVYLVMSKKHPNAAQILEKLERIAETIDVRTWGLRAP